MRAAFLLFLVSFITASYANAGWLVRQVRVDNKAYAIGAVDQLQEPNEQKVVRSLPRFLPEGAPPSKEIYEEVLYPTTQYMRLLNQPGFETLAASTKREWVGSEVRTLRSQGPKENRINLTIVGDGYTEKEKGRFFADAERITKDLFETPTFQSYLPLFNVYAVFVPSKDSGITDTVKRNTALGLYRNPANSKRAIYPGNPSAADRAIALAPATDYSILLANDEFYGGLGGQYAITTRSETSGTIVLRHELGHNFGDVGEEYDGGWVYSGANSDSSNPHWAAWAPNNQVKVFRTERLIGEYVWENLDKGEYKANFDFPSEPGWSFDFLLSAVGWSTPEDVEVKVDGKATPLSGKFHFDRGFYRPQTPLKLSVGAHSMVIRENRKDGDNVLGSAQAWAFPPDYDFTPDRIGAFPTFNEAGQQSGYRPTHESCLMRNMEVDKFCVVDKENMWLRFLADVDLIDSLSLSENGSEQVAVLKTPPLPHLEIQWFQNLSGRSQEIVEGRNQTMISIPEGFKGTISATVRFNSPEIRKTSPRLKSQRLLKI